MRVLILLNELEDKMESASVVPFSGKTLIDRDDVMDLLNEIRIQLPDEIKQAKWIKEERSKILNDAQEEAERLVKTAQSEANMILGNAKQQVDSLVDQNEIVKLAKAKGEKIISESIDKADEIKAGSYYYADEVIENLQKNLHQMMQTVAENREELQKFNQ